MDECCNTQKVDVTRHELETVSRMIRALIGRLMKTLKGLFSVSVLYDTLDQNDNK
jgi:hypothetical protein